MREQAQAEAERDHRARARPRSRPSASRRHLAARRGRDLATALAGRIVGESLEDDERSGRVVDRFLDDLEDGSRRSGAGVDRPGRARHARVARRGRCSGCWRSCRQPSVTPARTRWAATCSSWPSRLDRRLAAPGADRRPPAAQAKARLLHSIFDGKVAEESLAVADAVSPQRWSRTRDFCGALEQASARPGALAPTTRAGWTTWRTTVPLQPDADGAPVCVTRSATPRPVGGRKQATARDLVADKRSPRPRAGWARRWPVATAPLASALADYQRIAADRRGRA